MRYDYFAYTYIGSKVNDKGCRIGYFMYKPYSLNGVRINDVYSLTLSSIDDAFNLGIPYTIGVDLTQSTSKYVENGEYRLQFDVSVVNGQTAYNLSSPIVIQPI